MSSSISFEELAIRKADVKKQISEVSQSPGVYLMYGDNDQLLYVGKAKNLRNRTSSYFNGKPASSKVEAMVNQVVRLETRVTSNEVDALVLEHNLIKTHNPYYNVLLRDDKSYPYIMISNHPYPRVAVHRGAKKGGEFFGPYPNAGSVRLVLNELQKVIPVRQCEDTYFANRSRPCLQYQIKRCSAPCVGKVDNAEYKEEVQQLRLFLQGKSNVLHDRLVKLMQKASDNLEFEIAAQYRDRLQGLTRLLHQQTMEHGTADLDIVAGVQHGVDCAVVVLFVRNGAMVGQRQWFPKNPFEEPMSKVLFDFIAQIYARRPPPSEILVSEELDDIDVLEAYLKKLSERKISISHNVRANRRLLIKNAVANATNALKSKRLEKSSRTKRSKELMELLRLDEMPHRLECFDISHHGGSKTVASNVVFIDGLPNKNEYRRYNINGITPGDDYAAMAQAISRRFTAKEEGTERTMPDVLIIDGGKGQLSAVEAILEGCGVLGAFAVLAVAKGPTRKLGNEELYLSGFGTIAQVREYPAGLALIQHIRDESHRFAIAGHRAKKTKAMRQSPLEAIEGLGPKKRKALLQYFGGLNELKMAAVEEISRVNGINQTLAQRIYDYLK